MKTVPVRKFKAHCLSLLEEAARMHGTLVITKYGKPVVRVVPFAESSASGENPLKGSIVFEGNLVDPLDVTWVTSP